MGCNFDYFDCEYDLPAYPYMQKHQFQTKDLVCDMVRFKLTKHGKLVQSGAPCFNCGRTSFEEINSNHTGFVTIYNHHIISSELRRQNFYEKAAVGFCLNYEFLIEFFRGELKSIKDNSYVENKVWDEESQCFKTTKTWGMRDFIERFNIIGEPK